MKTLLLITCLFVLSSSKETPSRRPRTGPITMRKYTTTTSPSPPPITTPSPESPCKTILYMIFTNPTIGPDFPSSFTELGIPCHACYSCNLDTIVFCDSVTKIYTGMQTLNLVDRDVTIEQMCSYLGDSLDNIYTPGTNEKGMADCFDKCYYNPEIISKLKMVITAFKSANATQLFMERIGYSNNAELMNEEWMIPYEKYIDHYAPEICDEICNWANPQAFPGYPEYATRYPEFPDYRGDPEYPE